MVAASVIQITGKGLDLQQHKKHLQPAAAVIQITEKGCSVDASATT